MGTWPGPRRVIQGGNVIYSTFQWAQSVVEDTKLVIYKDEQEALKLKKVNQGSQPRKAWYLVRAGGGTAITPKRKYMTKNRPSGIRWENILNCGDWKGGTTHIFCALFLKTVRTSLNRTSSWLEPPQVT